jgi:Tfp pilus assembly protein PilX
MNRQRGISLIIVMIVLSVMLFAMVGIFRTSNATLGIVGNLGFKQNATSVGDLGVESARAFVMDPAIDKTVADDGYSAVWAAGFNPTTYDWGAAGNSREVTADDDTGNRVSWVIHRMCSQVGAITGAGQQCVLAPLGTGGSNQVSSLAEGLGNTKKAFYRITVRVEGARNSLSYVQVMVY